MPPNVREQIAADVKAVVNEPEINGKLVATGQNVNPGGPAEFAAEMNAQIKEVARVGKELDIRPGQN